MKNIIRNRQNKGITLIALVVTIVVLLILAGVSITMLSGDNGILSQATTAKEKNVHATVYENLLLEAEAFEIEKKVGLTKKTMAEDLTEKGIISPSSKNEGEYIINVEALCGQKLKYGNGTDEETDVYKLLETISVSKLASIKSIKLAKTGTTEKTYTLIYSGKKETVGESKILNIGDIYVEVSNEQAKIEVPEVTFSYNPPLTEYTKEAVIVTASVDSEDYTLEMSTDGTNYTSGDSITVNENGKVYARLMDGETEVETFEGEVTNIDKTVTHVGTIKCTNVESNAEIVADENGYFYYDNISRIIGNTIAVELLDGSDDKSGHKSTTCTIESVNGSEISTIYENATGTFSLGNMSYSRVLTTTCDGYNITVTTEDMLGNTASVTYYLRFSM